MIALSYSFLTRLARLLTRVILGSKFHLRGTQNVPASGPVLIVSNHVGAVDPAIIGGWTPRPVWFMAKAELFKGGWAWLMRGYHAFPVVRHSADRTARSSFGGTAGADRHHGNAERHRPPQGDPAAGRGGDDIRRSVCAARAERGW
ncbi:MAG: 1-acyl-sn-glycerol-3-phosphate acyltransferase [Chloroflexi bacterium]|nr:MAG: 1-acyl-sn-glycerol-3-phosphate acyltransferase [Chloroflexota bacterium]